MPKPVVRLLTGTKQYYHFHQEIGKWRKPYLDFVLKKLVQDDEVNKAETLQFGRFTYPEYDYNWQLMLNVFVLLLFNIILSTLLIRSLKSKSIQ